jgi:hypothetical protein
MKSVPILFVLVMAMAMAAFAQQASKPTASVGDAGAAGQQNSEMQAMANMDMTNVHEMPHMKLTPVRETQPGDHEKAEKIVAILRSTLGKYQDYQMAERDGFHIFKPNLPQKCTTLRITSTPSKRRLNSIPNTQLHCSMKKRAKATS